MKELKKKFDVLLLMHKHRATVYGMFKSGGRPKTVFSSLLFTQLCRTGNFCFWKFVYYIQIMRASSLAEQSCYPYQIAKILHLDDDAKINY